MSTTADGPDFTGSTAINGGTIDATITNSTVTVEPAVGSTFDITGPVSIPGNPQITTGWRGTVTDGTASAPAGGSRDIYGTAAAPQSIAGFGSLLLVLEVDSGTGMQVLIDYLIEVSPGSYSSIGASHLMVIESHAPHIAVVPMQADLIHVYAVNNNTTATDFSYTLTPLNESVNSVTYPVSDNALSESAVSVPANSTSSFYLPFVQPGPATFSFHARGGFANFNVSIYALNDMGANSVNVMTGQVALKDGVFQVTLPARTVVVAVSNTSTTAAGSLDMGLVPGGPT